MQIKSKAKLVQISCVRLRTVLLTHQELKQGLEAWEWREL